MCCISSANFSALILDVFISSSSVSGHFLSPIWIPFRYATDHINHLYYFAEKVLNLNLKRTRTGILITQFAYVSFDCI